MKIALAMMLSLTVAGCASLTQRLTGQWRYTDPIQSCLYVFNKDGTFAGEVLYYGKRISQFEGKWSVERERLLCQYTADKLHNIPVGTEDADKLLTVTEDYFVIEVADGSRRTYLRIK